MGTHSKNTDGLLSYRAAQRASPECCVFGFPLDEAGQKFIGDKLHPIPPGLSGEQLAVQGLVQAQLAHDHLTSECCAVWPRDRLGTVIGYTQGKYYPLIALAACKLPNDKLIPQGEDMAKLKEIMASNGFKDEPRWFVVAE
ncbi:hypothetical protein FPV67DRAFT_1760536 [Lyophyllum atratum]|nr:hypothetical protein FPV67DRAFT_1760536 [Lyophyllum atratum]